MTLDAGANTFVLTGLPRGGTTYLSAVLYHPPQVVTISDPQGVFRRHFREHGAGDSILDLFAGFRDRLVDGEPIPTLEGTEGYQGKGRVDTWNQEKVERTVSVDQDFSLGMKNPEVFLAHLDVFRKHQIRTVISVRHPISVINSWRKRTLKKQKAGTALKGFGAGVALHVDLKESDPFERALELHEHWCSQVIEAMSDPSVMIVRHEDWYSDPGQLSRIGAFVGVPTKDHLHPAPIAADPPDALTSDQVERIRSRCVLAAEFGYPLEKGLLSMPPTATGAKGPNPTGGSEQ